MGLLFDSDGTKALKMVLHKNFNAKNIGKQDPKWFDGSKSLLEICDLLHYPVPDDSSNPDSALKTRWKAFVNTYVDTKMAARIIGKLGDCVTAGRPVKFHALEDNNNVPNVTVWDEADTDVASTPGPNCGHILLTSSALPGKPVSVAVTRRAVERFLRKK
jgi:hypothetical protein